MPGSVKSSFSLGQAATTIFKGQRTPEQIAERAAQKILDRVKVPSEIAPNFYATIYAECSNAVREAVEEQKAYDEAEFNK